MDDFYSDTNWKLIYFDTSAQSESCERTLSLVTCVEHFFLSLGVSGNNRDIILSQPIFRRISTSTIFFTLKLNYTINKVLKFKVVDFLIFSVI